MMVCAISTDLAVSTDIARLSRSGEAWSGEQATFSFCRLFCTKQNVRNVSIRASSNLCCIWCQSEHVEWIAAERLQRQWPGKPEPRAMAQTVILGLPKSVFCSSLITPVRLTALTDAARAVRAAREGMKAPNMTEPGDWPSRVKCQVENTMRCY